MKILRLSYINLKRISKNKLNIVMMFLLPLIIIIGNYFMINKGGFTTTENIAFYIEDTGDYGEELIDDMGLSGEVLEDFHHGMDLLETNKIIGLYKIPGDFTEKIRAGEKPLIEVFRREEGNATIPLESELEDRVNRQIKEEILLKHNIIKDRSELYLYQGGTIINDQDTDSISGDFYMAILMVVYFIILSSTGLVEEMLRLKKENILARAMTTANRGYEIMASLLLSTLFLLAGANILVVLIGKIIMGYTIKSYFIVITNIILASMFSISLSVFLARLSTNAGFVSIATAIYSVASFFLSAVASEPDYYPEVPKFIFNLGKFMPQYWIMDSVENSRFFPNTLVMALMILALFTAGNYRFRDFANKN